ncbi:MAG: trigger factor [Bacteriovoracaceae bacterium]
MSYQVEQVNGCTKKFLFKYEQVDLTKQVESALVEQQKKSNLKGFRPGKAPLDLVKKFYGGEVEGKAIEKFISQEYYNAIEKEGIHPVGYPNFLNSKIENSEGSANNKKISFEVVVEIFPNITIKDFSKLSFKKEDETISAADIEKTKKMMFKSKAQMVEVNDVALKDGLFAVLNFQGEKENGEKPEEMKGEEFLLEIGSKTFIPGFEDQLIGMKAKEKKDITVTFPSDYHMAELKNAKVKFHVELLEVKEQKYPEINDELVKEFGYESVSDFNEKTEKNLSYQKKRTVAENLNREILDKLVTENSFDIPSAMVANQEKHVKEDLKNNLLRQGFKEEHLAEYYEKWKEDITQKATYQIKTGLILDKLGKDFSIEVTDADFDEKFKEMGEMAGPKVKIEDVKKYYNSNTNLKNNLLYAIREEKTLKKIHSMVTIK